MTNCLSITNYLPDRAKAALRHPSTALKIFTITMLTRFYRTFLGSCSQHGEDIIIHRLLKMKKNGFYVDVGANDPEVISNTMYFYKKGWRGINIEPHPEVFQKITKIRSNDVNLNFGIAATEGELTYYKLDKPLETAGSTFDKNIAEELQDKGYILSSEIKMPVKPLSSVFDANINGQEIDFMSVDTEGFDLQVLQSNDWQKYRPQIVIVETTINEEEINDFMFSQKYKIVYQNLANTIFEKQ